MLSGKFVFVFKIRILDMLGKPIFCKVKIFFGYWSGDPGECLEEDVVLLLVSVGVTRLTTGHKLLLLIIKMVSEHISVEVEKVNISWILSHLLKTLKQHLVFIINPNILIIG